MSNYTMEQIKGVIPALLTMFDKDESVDVNRTRNIVDFLIERGVNGFYLTGSTGEGFLMDREERNLVVDTVVEQTAGRCPVIVHVGDIGTKKSIQLAEHAWKAGADAISSVPPFYWSFSADDIYNYYRDISEATPLPMIIYNVPMAGLLGSAQIMRLAKLPNVKGIKFTGKNHDQMSYLIANIDNFKVYSGSDEMALSGLAVGADGIIGSFYNVMPELFLKIYAAVKDGEINAARRLQQIGTDIILACLDYDYLSVMRSMIKWQGVDAGYSRRPFRNYDDSELTGLKKKLLAIKEKYSVTEVRFYDSLR